MLGAMRKRYAWHRVKHLWALPLLMATADPSAAQPAPVPPPLEQLQADCTRPQYASDTLVCGDAELRTADAQVAALAGTPPTLAAGAIWEDQAAWLRRRSLCAFTADHRGCLVAAYTDRRSVLVAASAPATQPLRCTGTWQGRSLKGSAIAPDQPITIRENALLLGVATAKSAHWLPALAWVSAGRGIKLEVQDGRQFNCRPAPN